MTSPTSPALPFPVLPDASVESCIVALVAALQQSKGWMHGYADAIVRDAVDRVQPAGTDKDFLTVAEPFPPRILALLEYVAERNPPEGLGPYEDENGEPMQDDADAALRWLTDAQSALLAQAAEKDAEIERLRADAERYRYIRNWTRGEQNHNGRKQQFNFDFPKPLSNVMQGSVSQHLDAAIDASRAPAQKEKT